MKIVILTNGTRGDIQPLIYLGQTLIKHNFEVSVVASENFSALIENAGLIHNLMPVNMQEFMESEEGRIWMKKISKNPFAMISQVRKMIPRLAISTLDAYWSACQGADLIVTTTGALGDVLFKDKLNIPLVEIQLQPLEPTSEFAYPLIHLPFNSGSFNKFTYYYFEWFLGVMFKKSLKKWQKDNFGTVRKYKGGPFAERRRCADLKIGSFSSSLVARPADWPEKYHICGNFFPADSTEAESDPLIDDFLKEGPAPVYIGFGSMVLDNTEKISSIISQIIEQTDRRIIFAKGWTPINIQSVPGRLLVVDHVSHSRLFPRTSGIIHHGGAGTTAAALKAGIPQMIFPKTADQPFWADRVFRAGLSPKPFKLEKLTYNKLEEIFVFLQSAEAADRSAEIKKICSDEKGTEKAAELIQNILA